MASHQQSSLLSLGGGVENLLLSYVSSGDGGLKSILNLRQVCSTTKKWIENLPAAQAEQIFAKCQVEMDFNEVDQIDEATKETTYKNPFDAIRKFLEFPPPARLIVNSLKLSGMKAFAAKKFSPDEQRLWGRFTLFLWGRLENLEVDYFDDMLPSKQSRVSWLLSPSIQRLHCNELEVQMESSALPKTLFYVEHLSIDKLKLSANWTTRFFEYFARTPRLQSLDVPVWEIKDLEEVTTFLVLTKDKANFELRFTVGNGDVWAPGTSLLGLSPSFVSAVAASSASIRIGDYPSPAEGWVKDNLDYMKSSVNGRLH